MRRFLRQAEMYPNDQEEERDPLSEFLQYCVDNGYHPNQDALDQYSEESDNISPEQYDDLVNLITYNKGLGEDEYSGG
jgi:hypothetical protein